MFLLKTMMFHNNLKNYKLFDLFLQLEFKFFIFKNLISFFQIYE